MSEHQRATRHEVLPPELASQLLARASELDAASFGSTVSELREAAAEAGISASAFEAALVEVENAHARKLGMVAPVRRERRKLTVALGMALLAAGGFVALTRTTVQSPERGSPPQPVQAAVADPGTMQVVVRSAQQGTAITMGVQRDGRLFAALGVAPGDDGRRVGQVDLGGTEGTATTPAALQMSEQPGEVTFRAPAGGPALEINVPGTSTQVRGHAVRLVRDRPGGPLRAEVAPSSTK